MKKFLIYLVSILVVVAIGFTVFFVVRDDESIYISANTMYVDVNDTFTLDVSFENKKSYTTVEITSHDPSVVRVVESDDNGATLKAVGGGWAQIRVKTSNVKFRNLVCDIMVGDGTKNNPFYIRSAQQLAEIGNTKIYNEEDETEEFKYPMTACYKLIGDIDLSSYNDGYWQPIGTYREVTTRAFEGEFDGNGYTISGLKINIDEMNEQLNTTEKAEEVGLFAKLGAGAKVAGVKFNTVNINGTYKFGGVVAGYNEGATIERIEINHVFMNNQNLTSPYVGGVVGYMTATSEMITNSTTGAQTPYHYVPKVDRCSLTDVRYGYLLNPDGQTYDDGKLVGTIGGLVGYNQGGTVVFSYVSDGMLKASEVADVENTVGGLVGYNTHYDANGTITNASDFIGGHIKDCYASIDFDGIGKYYGRLIGYYNFLAEKLEVSSDKTVEKVINKVYGLVYNSDKKFVGESAIGNSDNTDAENPYLVDQAAVLGAQYVAYGLTESGMQNSFNFVSYVKELGSEEITYSWLMNDIWYMYGSNVNHGFPVLDYTLKTVSYGISDIGDAQTISNANEFINMDPSKEYVISEDIIIDNSDGSWTGIDNFSGALFTAQKEDGVYYTITIKNAKGEKCSAPLFNTITETGQIYDLHLVNSDFENLTNEYFGMIANENYGVIQNAVIENCRITGGMNVGAVTGHNLGGVLGQKLNDDTYIYTQVNNSKVYVQATKNDISLGAIVGYNENGSIRYARTNTTVVEVKVVEAKINQNNAEPTETPAEGGQTEGSTETENGTEGETNPETPAIVYGKAQVGGIVGYNFSGLVEDVVYYNRGTTGVKASDKITNIMIGGVAGESSGRMILCYAYANISSVSSFEEGATNISAYAGGLAGKISGDPVKVTDAATGEDSFLTHIEKSGFIGGSVTGYYAGGLAGCISVGSNPVRKLTQDAFEYWVGSSQDAVKSTEAPIDITESYANGSVSGEIVGGLAAYVTNGRINNCYAEGTLKGKSGKSSKAGLVNIASFSYITQNEECVGAIVEYSYSNCEFDANGTNYALASGNFRKSSFRDFIGFGAARQDGFFLKCVYNVDQENAGDAQLPSGDATASFVIGSQVINLNTKDWMVGIQNFWNNITGSDAEFFEALVGDYNRIVCKDADMSGSNPSAFTTKNNYSQAVWKFEEGKTPTLQGCYYFALTPQEDGSYKFEQVK